MKKTTTKWRNLVMLLVLFALLAACANTTPPPVPQETPVQPTADQPQQEVTQQPNFPTASPTSVVVNTTPAWDYDWEINTLKLDGFDNLIVRGMVLGCVWAGVRQNANVVEIPLCGKNYGRYVTVSSELAQAIKQADTAHVLPSYDIADLTKRLQYLKVIEDANGKHLEVGFYDIGNVTVNDPNFLDYIKISSAALTQMSTVGQTSPEYKLDNYEEWAVKQDLVYLRVEYQMQGSIQARATNDTGGTFLVTSDESLAKSVYQRYMSGEYQHKAYAKSLNYPKYKYELNGKTFWVLHVFDNFTVIGNGVPEGYVVTGVMYYTSIYDTEGKKDVGYLYMTASGNRFVYCKRPASFGKYRWNELQNLPVFTYFELQVECQTFYKQ